MTRDSDFSLPAPHLTLGLFTDQYAPGDAIERARYTLAREFASPNKIQVLVDEAAAGAMITANTAAEELGLPTMERSEAEQLEARSKAAAVLRLFLALSQSLHALYAAIVVEGRPPIPENLGAPSSSLGTEIFFSTRLLEVAPDLEDGVRAAFDSGVVVDVAGGLFVSGWADFNDQGRTMREPLRASRDTAIQMRSAMSNLIPKNDG